MREPYGTRIVETLTDTDGTVWEIVAGRQLQFDERGRFSVFDVLGNCAGTFRTLREARNRITGRGYAEDLCGCWR